MKLEPPVLIRALAIAALLMPFVAQAQVAAPAAKEQSAKQAKLPPTPEQKAIIDADSAVPADKSAMRIENKTTLPNGAPNPNFGKPMARFLDMHKTFLDRGKQPMDVLFVGDSITQGWLGRGNTVWMENFGTPYKAANFGIGGDRTQHVLWRIENGEMDGIMPKVVVLLIGTNNSSRNTPDEIAKGVAKIVEQIHAKIPSSKIIVMALTPRSLTPTDPRRQLVMQTNPLLEKLANGKDVFYVKVWDPFLDEQGRMMLDLMPDCLHPNEAGYVVMAKAIKDKIVELISQ